MTSKFMQFLLALVLCVTLAPGAYAKGQGHGNGHGGDKQHNDHDKDRDHADRDRDDHDRDHDRDSDDKRPAGWDKGKKTGWGDCDVPPGQVKKLGCHPNSKHRVARHHDTDRDHNRDRDRDRDRHVSTTKPPTTTTTTVKKTTTASVPAQTREQARRTGGRKVYNDDGTWHYEGSTPTTATKK